VTTNDRPSAFIDSPEDLIRKARVMIDAGAMDPKVALLMADLARELGKSREGHASRMSMVSANASEMNELRDENKAMRVTTAESRKEIVVLRRYSVGFLVICLIQAVILVVVSLR
jgi:hypothetical protein